MGSRGAVFETQPSSSAGAARGGACAIRTSRGGGKGGPSPARQLSGHYRRAASEKFSLEDAGRYCPLPGRTFESRHPLDQVDAGRNSPETQGKFVARSIFLQIDCHLNSGVPGTKA